MSFVAAKCTQCGANIEVDDTKDAGICNNCGTAFVTHKAINNYNTYVTKHITKNIYGKEKTEVEQYLENGETFLKLKNWDSAANAFKQASEIAPDNYRCWLGLVKCTSKNFTLLNDLMHIGYYKNAIAVANQNEKEVIDNICGQYMALSEEHIAKVNKFNIHNGIKGALGWLTILLGVICIVTGIVLGNVIDWKFYFLGLFGVLCITVLIIYFNLDFRKAKKLNDSANLDA